MNIDAHDIEIKQEGLLLQRERNALERERLALEKLDKIQTENNELRIRNRVNWAVFAPVLVAVVGGTFSVLGTAYSQYLQSEQLILQAAEKRTLSRETAEQELIKIAVQSDPARALANMQFLTSAKLLKTYGTGVTSALARGQTFSTKVGSSRECLTAGCFYAPKAQAASGRAHRIWGNYSDTDQPKLASHGNKNAEQFCKAKRFTRSLDFEVSCVGEDESAYLAWSSGEKKWAWLESGSANSYCFPLIEWVRCGE